MQREISVLLKHTQSRRGICKPPGLKEPQDGKACRSAADSDIQRGGFRSPESNEFCFAGSRVVFLKAFVENPHPDGFVKPEAMKKSRDGLVPEAFRAASA